MDHRLGGRHDVAAEASHHNMKPLTVKLHDGPAPARPSTMAMFSPNVVNSANHSTVTVEKG